MRGIGELGRQIAGVAEEDVRARRYQGVDAVEHRVVECQVDARELRLELPHRARPDDRRRDRGMGESEGHCHVDHADAGLVTELDEFFHDIELALIERSVVVVQGAVARSGPAESALVLVAWPVDADGDAG